MLVSLPQREIQRNQSFFLPHYLVYYYMSLLSFYPLFLCVCIERSIFYFHILFSRPSIYCPLHRSVEYQWHFSAFRAKPVLFCSQFMYDGIFDRFNDILKAILSDFPPGFWRYGKYLPVSPALSVHNTLTCTLRFLINFPPFTVFRSTLVFISLLSSRNTIYWLLQSIHIFCNKNLSLLYDINSKR